MQGLLVSLIPLAVLALIIGGLTSTCSFSPGGPNTDGALVRTVDAGEQVPRLARSLTFPVRVPTLPPGWRATSVDVERAGPPGAAKVLQIGWLTPAGTYLRLSQSTAAEADLVPFEVGAPRAATGTTRSAGHTWVTYPGRRDERLWVTELDGVRVLLTGSAGEAEFGTLATAATTGPVLR